MVHSAVTCISLVIVGFLASYGSCDSSKSLSLLMPNVKPEESETKLCKAMKIDEAIDIIGFDPKGTSQTAHHMLIYGCEVPGNATHVYSCGYNRKLTLKGTTWSRVCKRGFQVVYAWANNAQKLELPEGVAFKVGGQNRIKYLVLQVHYASVEKFKAGATDNSGVILQYTQTPQLKAASVYIFSTAGYINAGSSEDFELACTLKEDQVIHPFAYRTHTHILGEKVSGYKVVKDEWTLFAEKNPQLPQTFYPVSQELNLTKGDTVAVRCTMHNFRNSRTRIGPTSHDEMCILYMMYWMDAKSEPLRSNVFFSKGPPHYYWRTDERFKSSPPRGY